MEIIFLEYPIRTSTAVVTAVPKTAAIGHFDGVHRGHQNVIQCAIDAAKAEGLQSAVMTFHPHPKEVLGQGNQYLTSLTPLEGKIQRFLRLGVDVVYIIKFDLDFSVVTPPQFVDEVLRPLQIKKAIVGFDFAFGARGTGKAETLRSLGEPDIKVEVVEKLMENGEKVSSTLIRESLAEGRLEVVEQLLGAPYEVEGIVVHGEGRGRTIGFPTANLELDAAYVLPRQGVYAIIAEVEGKRIAGVLNLGVKPTFHEQLPKPVLEAHLFDFSGDLYDKSVKIQFISFLRAEKKFGSIDELIHQIHSDADQARTILTGYIK